MNAIFNRVDRDRVKEVGPDRACAEWLLRSGASIRWKGMNHVEKDYNHLPSGAFEKYKIEEIDATDSAIMSIGFPHLENLEHVKRIILHNCKYLNDSALPYLNHVKDSLQYLQISGIGGITETGLQSLSCLSNLQELLLFDLSEIRDKKRCLDMLKPALPTCKVNFPDVDPTLKKTTS